MKHIFRDLTFSLRATLVSTVILSLFFAIFLTVGVMGVPAYFKTRKALKDLWKNYSSQVAQTATEEVLSYFQSAPIMLKFINSLTEEEAITQDSLEKTFDICYSALKENPEFVSVYFASIEGALYGVFREGDHIFASASALDSKGLMQMEEYRIGPRNLWILSKTAPSTYDPRTRPFWQTGKLHPEGSWTEPYEFVNTHTKGYTYVLGAYVKGALKGFWAIDYQIDGLSSYLEKLSIGKDGSIYIIADDGSVIGQSPKVYEEPHPVVKEGWKLFLEANTKEAFVSIPPKIYYLNRFPQKDQIPWNLVTVIHENDYLKPIRKQMLHTFYWGLIPCLLLLLFVAGFFGKVSKRMREIARDIDRAGNLDIEKREAKHSKIREVNMVEGSLQKMKVGLTSFSKYVPLDIVKKLLISAKVPTLGGEKKQITILFADLDQFTSLAEKKDPAEITKILGKFLDLATKEIHKERGIVDKFLGDAVMALWGALEPLNDHAIRACKMALTLKELAKEEPHLKFKVGINTGEATVGNFGSHERMDYTAIGDAVNVASRLEKVNKIYHTQILIGPETAKAVKNRFLVRLLDWASVPGRFAPVGVYELMGEKEKAAKEVLKGIEIYNAALHSYKEKRFEEAFALFGKANAAFGGKDTPSMILEKRSFSYAKKGVPANWNGAALPED